MTTSQPRYQDPAPEPDCSCADQLSETRPATPLIAVRPGLPVPPPQFGRLPHSIRSAQAARAGVRQPVARSQAVPRSQAALAPTELLDDRAPSAHPVTPQQPPLVALPPPAPSDLAVVSVAQVPGPLAGFGARAVSFLIDYVAPVVVLNLLLAIGAITGGTAWRAMLVTGGYLWLLGFGLWNSGYLQGTTGQSLGRRVAGTKLVGIETGQPVGFSRAVLRQICHVLELGIGYLWPLWDGQRQTFADKIMGTVVIGESTMGRSPDRPRLGV